jgi:hypothetical protein
MMVYLLSLKRLPMAKRLAYAGAGLLLFACVAAGISGCSGSSGGGAHTDSITAVYGGDTLYSPSTSTAISITIH